MLRSRGRPIRGDGKGDGLTAAVWFLGQELKRHNDLIASTPQTGHNVWMLPAVSPPATVAVTIDEALSTWKDALTARGVRGSSIVRFTQLVTRAAKHNGWVNTNDPSYVSAVAFLSFYRRGDHGGKRWGPSTYNQGVTVLRTFGEHLRRSKLTTVNVMEDLQSWRQAGGDGCRALTVEEARKVIRVALARQSDARAHGFAALFWELLFLTGLRYAEGCSLRWGDLTLDGPTPCIRLRADADGNKAKRKDFIGLHAELAGLLRQWYGMVAHGDLAPVFPVVPTRATWRQDRSDAGIQEKDRRGRKTSVHCCRKSFCTWIDLPGMKSGEVAAIARHRATITEKRYIDPPEEPMYNAIQLLPCLWPADGGDLSTLLKRSPDSSSGFAIKRPIRYGVDAIHTSNAHTPVQPLTDSSDDPHVHGRGSHPFIPGGSSLGAVGMLEPQASEVEITLPFGSVSPITDPNRPDRATDEVALVLAQWLKLRLTGGSRKGPTDGTGSDPHP